MTVLSNEDLIEIRTLMSLGWNPKRIFEFRIANELRSARDWKIWTIYEACKRIRINQGDVGRKEGSGRPISISTPENVHRVELLLRSPPRIPGTHLPARKVAKGTGISRSSIQ